MTESVSIFITGEPAGQPRIKAASRGQFVSIYTPKKVKDSKTGKYRTHPCELWKAAVADEWRRSAPKMPKIQVPVAVELHFFFARPKAHSTKRGLRPDAPLWQSSKPDADNLAKAICDALTQLGVWADDDQVATLLVTKRYTMIENRPQGCQLTISPLQDVPKFLVKTENQELLLK